MKLQYVIPITIALGGCMPAETPDPTGPSQETCDANKFMNLTGKDMKDLSGIELPKNSRVIGYGMAYTQDYQPDRLNIGTDKMGMVDRIWCG